MQAEKRQRGTDYRQRLDVWFHSQSLCSIASTTKQNCPSPSHLVPSLVPLQCLQSAYTQFKLMHAELRDSNSSHSQSPIVVATLFLQPPRSRKNNMNAFSPIIATRYRPGPACMAEQLDISIHAPTACYQHHSLVPKDPLINTTWPDESMTATIAKTKHFCCRCCSVLFISFPLSQVTSPHPTNAAHLYHPSLKSLRESGRVRWRAPPLQTQPKCVQTAMDATCGMSPAEAGSLGLEAASRYFISGRAELGFRESKRNNSGVAQATCQRILTLPL